MNAETCTKINGLLGLRFGSMSLTETPHKKARKYLASIETVLCRMEITKVSSNIDEKFVQSIVTTAKSYVEDARHYLEEKPSTALAAVSYAEGLLDALRLLGLAKFTWPEARGDKH